ncbi:DUF6602 domain-containing protein [Sphingobacterium daejeonense]|uniref:DUF6602 domain-containing protein n=1 Tax=Sphingobacterium daejeonense TaxID=371142 RepID=UPI0010C25F78|nr:DUF6602 domain-containing protein [Sphingobacterium daejeonense]VTQ01717.1 Uncharacterised protein [Sphingobacterium daejeonense]
MGNKVFQTVLKRKIEHFTSTFVSDSKSIFYNKNDKLFHPAELGKYREESLKDLLKNITKQKISNGFIITSEDSVSTQLDIVIYQNNETPILEEDYVNFFSIESTIAIGEVKSNLNKKSFKESLIKLSNAKKLSKERQGLCLNKETYPKEHHDVISFLVCKDLKFNLGKVDFDDIYKGIEYEYRHNLILIIEKGFFHYKFDWEQLDLKDKEIFKNKGLAFDNSFWYYYPIYCPLENPYKCFNKLIEIDINNKHDHIEKFLISLSHAISYKKLYFTDIVEYLNQPTTDFLK